MTFPRLYAILDRDTLASRSLGLEQTAEAFAQAGVTLVQLRSKTSTPQQILAEAAIVRQTFPSNTTLILNDRADLAALAGFSGVHLGQTDLPPADARLILPGGLIGISTHTLDEVRQAQETTADSIAIGPVFATATKLDAAPVVGLDLLRRARELTTKPIVAIGGITRQNARSVIEAGADSVAVISALLAPGERVEKTVRDFLDILR